MPEGNVTIESVCKESRYVLTVEGGDGDGKYKSGSSVAIVADEPKPGENLRSGLLFQAIQILRTLNWKARN